MTEDSLPQMERIDADALCSELDELRRLVSEYKQLADEMTQVRRTMRMNIAMLGALRGELDALRLHVDGIVSEYEQMADELTQVRNRLPGDSPLSVWPSPNMRLRVEVDEARRLVDEYKRLRWSVDVEPETAEDMKRRIAERAEHMHAQGMTYKDIASELSIDEKTLRTYRKSLAK